MAAAGGKWLESQRRALEHEQEGNRKRLEQKQDTE